MPATMQQIGDILTSGLLNDSEIWVVKWQFRLLGDFEMALCEAIKRADDNNLMALSLGFPTQVNGYRQWTYGDLGRRLRALGLDI
jgi:hypothetical protein